MSDLSALSVNELADRAGAGAQRYKLSIRRAAVAELARRATVMQVSYYDRLVLTQRAEAAEKARDEQLDLFLREKRARLAAEKERDEAVEKANDYAHSWDEWKALAEKLAGERDTAEARLAEVQADLARVHDELVARVQERDAQEARLAETLKAIQAALNELGVPNVGYPAPVANAVKILRAALTPHPATDRVCECLDGGHDSGDGVHCMCTGVLPRALTTHPTDDA